MDKCASSNRARLSWRALTYLILFSLLAGSWAKAGVNLSQEEALRIGRKIWNNECGGTIAGLTSWNAGENFASLGIGHFIWYPAGQPGPFEESFPKFLRFAISRGADMPIWLRQSAACPWNSRAEFLRSQSSIEMKELRAFLARTVELQTQFLVARLQAALSKMLDQAGPAERENVRRQFDRVANSANGYYALIDYVNFKGEGTLLTERYRGQGWGLLQVLEGMHGSTAGPGALDEFSKSATEMLKQRVQNSPPARHESQWLPGWINRVKSYRANS